MESNHSDVIIVGAGFTGLVAARALLSKGFSVRVLECDQVAGGLAGSFEFSDGVRVEKFYHHWFNNDRYVPELVRELGMQGDVIHLPARTGMYFNRRIWKLSSPLDLLRFTALPLWDRVRLGLLVLQVQRVKDWRSIEHLSIREWLEGLCGKRVYDLVWKPLIESKFSVYTDAVSAVWMWKKLVLRGSTRNASGGEELAYFRGGFVRLAEALVADIEKRGGQVVLNCPVTGVQTANGLVQSVETPLGSFTAKHVLMTPSFTLIANLLEGHADPQWISSLRRVRYLGNVCLVLRLNQSLSETYWLNVNDPGFPFVGVIEHTNFDAPEHYRGSHIIYLSRYLPTEDPVWSMDEAAYRDFAVTHLKRMFPAFDASWILDWRVWRSEYAQPVTERNYSQYVPGRTTPLANLSISTMAQIYPEDRGTNYAIREGLAVADDIAHRLG